VLAHKAPGPAGEGRRRHCLICPMLVCAAHLRPAGGGGRPGAAPPPAVLTLTPARCRLQVRLQQLAELEEVIEVKQAVALRQGGWRGGLPQHQGGAGQPSTAGHTAAGGSCQRGPLLDPSRVRVAQLWASGLWAWGPPLPPLGVVAVLDLGTPSPATPKPPTLPPPPPCSGPRAQRRQGGLRAAAVARAPARRAAARGGLAEPLQRGWRALLRPGRTRVLLLPCPAAAAVVCCGACGRRQRSCACCWPTPRRHATSPCTAPWRLPCCCCAPRACALEPGARPAAGQPTRPHAHTPSRPPRAGALAGGAGARGRGQLAALRRAVPQERAAAAEPAHAAAAAQVGGGRGRPGGRDGGWQGEGRCSAGMPRVVAAGRCSCSPSRGAGACS
jgi:hypothetical protein